MPEELNRAAEDFLRENLRRSQAPRLHQIDPQQYPKTEFPALNARERNLLFFGRSPEHHTAEMRELKFYWGLSREERGERVQALRDGKLAPSPTLEKMIVELDSRQTLPALRHFQAAIINKDMHNPGRLNLQEMYERLPPHERTFLIEKIGHMKQARDERFPAHETPNSAPDHEANAQPARAFGAVPKESASYREYMANMGEIELRLLNEAVRQRQNGQAILNKESGQLTITEARSLFPREEQIKIREQARSLAWEQITPHEVFSPNPDQSAVRLSDAIAHLQEDTQQRARLAHKVFDEFAREKIVLNGKKGTISADKLNGVQPTDSQRLKALEDYAARMREELYRGFESLDAMRGELEKSRIYDETGRDQLANLNSYPSPHSDQFPSFDGHSADKNLQLANSAILELDRNPNVGDRPGDREQHPWLVDSTGRWHFDSVRDLAEPAPMQMANESAEHVHEYDFER